MTPPSVAKRSAAGAPAATGSAGPPAGTVSDGRTPASQPAGRLDPRHDTLRWRTQFAAEFALARGIAGGLGLLGWRAATGLAARLARFAHTPLGVRRDIVEGQLAASFPEWSADHVRRVARRAYDSLGRTFVETATLHTLDRDALLRRMREVTGWEHLEAAMAGGRGAMLITGHLGNWEYAGAYVAARGIPLDVIAKRAANPHVDRWVTRTRERSGMRVVFDDEAVRRTPRALREGRAVAFLCDQDARGLASTFVPFFGRPARTPRGPAVFALRLGAPVLFVQCTRRDDRHYALHIEPLAMPERTGDREHDVDAIVAAYTARLEAAVRETPSQYFWHHRRWKRQPPPAAAASPAGSAADGATHTAHAADTADPEPTP